MLGYELSIYEIVPLEVFLFHIKKEKKKEKKKKIRKNPKAERKEKKLNKRPIQLISFNLWEYFNCG